MSAVSQEKPQHALTHAVVLPAPLHYSLPYLASRLRFSSGNLQVVQRIEVDGGCFVEVLGDSGGGSYEWLSRTPLGIAMHSDCGYGSSLVALRDGLIAYLGLPRGDA